MKKKRILCLLYLIGWGLMSYPQAFAQILVNQAGYNRGESKHFVCLGAKDGVKFKIVNTASGRVEFQGEIINQEGWFTAFNPVSKDEFRVEMEGYNASVPFWIADHLIEKLSSKLGYEFFIDVRGSEDPINANLPKVYGGGPSRDGGAYGLETIFECLQYASNPVVT